AYVHSRDYQSRGLVGTPIDLEMNPCYFAGTIYTRDNSAGGIASLIDGGESFVLNNSFAAVPLLVRANSSFGAYHRVLGNENGKAYTLDNNYALADARMGKYESLGMSDSDDPASLDGAGKTFAELTSPDFIANTLGWDGAVWTTAAGVLPRFAWQKEAVTVEKIYADYNTSARVLPVGEPSFIGNGTLPGAVYTTSNPEVATIDNNGVITGKSSGKATITVSVPADATQKGLEAKTYEVELVGVVYNITNASELNAMRFDLAGEFTLANDIDLSGIENFEAIGSNDAPFTGKLNGNGHVIKNLTMNVTGDDKGFFGTANGATIDKVGFENARVVWSGNGGANIAVVVGRAVGVTITNSYVANSYVYGRDHVASFVGGSFAGGDPTLVEDCYSTSRIQTSQYQVGGIMGTMINAHINRCHFSGIINAPGTNAGAFVSLVDAEADVNSVTNSICLAIKIEGNSTGRIIGNTGGRPTTMENNYGLETTSCSGSDNADEAVTTGRQGETVGAIDARDEAFYTEALGWDMTNTWKMIADAFPVLAWQELPVNGQFFGLPEDITLIEGKGNFDLGDIAGNLGQDYDVEEVDTKYLRIRASISCSKWPETTTTTYIRFSSQNPDINSTVDIPVTIIPASESFKQIATAQDLVEAALNPGLDYMLVNDIDMAGV
ncbi:MAG: Ig-like domain-containing protein, partial [Muribaculaceae bacterium]|nr:Ig-like domain-containing protein [Muribaculaceae bacterium]